MTARSISPLVNVRDAVRGRAFILEGDCAAAAAIRAACDNRHLVVVGVCSNPSEGEKAIREMRPGLVFSDIFFREEPDGIDLCRRVQDELGIPVVLVGQSPDPFVMLRVAMAQPVGCVPKPEDAVYLQAVLDRAFRGVRVMATAPF